MLHQNVWFELHHHRLKMHVIVINLHLLEIFVG